MPRDTSTPRGAHGTLRSRHILACFAALAILAIAHPDPVETPGLGESRSGGDWLSGVQGTIEREEYHASVSSAGLQAPNRAQNLRTYFKDSGIEIVPRSVEKAAWRWQWRMAAWGREDLIHTAASVPPAHRGARVEYARGALVEWYENRKEGLEQGFTISAAPDGMGMLCIEGRFSDELRPELDASGTALDLFDARGVHVLRYAGLVVQDATQRRLNAHLALSETSLRILVDDRDAVYPIVVDPLMTSPSWTGESNQTGGYFGVSVGTAGDVNGDGYSDVIVGAHQYDSGQNDEGRAFVYLGSSTGLVSSPAWTAESDQAGAFFGTSVSTAGDVNGDGYGDVIVGANLYDNVEDGEGRAFVYLGSSSGLADSAAWTAESNQGSAAFGVSVATAGDVNGDGYSDVIVGAYFYDNGQSNEGAAFVYLGSSSGLASSAAWTGESDQVNAVYGISVASAGDVNGDGYSDVIVGSHQYDNGQTEEGRAFVYFGSSTGLATSAAWTAESDQTDGKLGWSVAAAGDVNGDGYGDVIVGALNYSNGQTAEGRAFVYLGSSTGPATSAAWTAESNQGSAWFGYSVATAGDVNGDGYSDVIVGARDYSNGQPIEGRAYMYLGSASGLAASSAWTAESDQTSAYFGISVATAGDVNGDGYSDVIVGAYAYDNGQPDEGSAFAYLGSASGLATAAGWTAESNQGGTMFGVSVASAGDVNGDGYSDVIVGAHRYDHDLADEGRAFVYLGSASGLAASAAWTAESDQAGAFFGHWVASAGDVNGDGYGDVIVGARRYDNGESEEGRAYVYLGSASGLATSAAWTAEGDQDGANFGWSAATAGDVNGDGFGDVIVGANMYTDGQSGEGKAFVYLGSSSGLATSASWTAEGNQTGAAFGVSVASAGDVNGDAYSDVIIGAYKYTNGQSEEGRAFLYLGSASGLATSAAWTAESDQTGALFGISAATAGDVNGDGYSDVIVGASGYGNGQSVEGRAFVYIGSGSGLASSAAWTAESDQAGAQFGYSVATAGDVNGDGYSDVIVGARDYMNGQTDEGRAFAYLGSGSGLAITAAWTAESDQLGAEYGLSVANAGDVNGDGYGDVIVGAWSYDNGQTDEGRSFAYFGNGGDGLDRIPQQRRADDTTPIAPLGKSDSKTMFRLKALGRTPAGRGQVRLVAEVKPLLSPFTGVGISAGPWVNTGLPAIGSGSATLLNNFLTGLSPAHVYHWRIRVETTSPFFPRSPWFSPSHNGAEESDFRTAGFDVQPLFGPWTDFATATGPRSVATGDFNGDGRPDLAVADSSDDKVSVLLGSGTGTFGAKTDFATREGPASVAIGDFNDDGRRDLAVVGAGGDAVSVLLGIGNGTFGPKADFGTGVPPVSVATEDLNGDVDLDLAVANKGDNTVSVLLGNGSGSFGANSDFATGSSPVSVAIADLNADTKPDLAVANQASNTISVLLGNGLGSFSLASNPETGTSPSSVAIRDLNGNGVPDLVATNRGSNTVSVLLGNGNGTFGAKSDFGTGSSPASVAIADFDVDGKSDLAVANAGSNTVSVLLGNGNGTFGTKTDFGTGVRPECVVVADLNGDGRRDLAVACVASNRVSILLNQGGPAVPDLAPVVASPVSVNAEEGGTLSISVAAGDLDGEGITFLEPNLSSLPAGNDAVFTTNANHTSGTLIWHPKSAHAGTYNVIFTASNALSGSDTTRIDVAAAGASITGRLLWTPAAGETGVFDITYTATDAFGDTTFAVTRVTVTGGSGVAVPTVHTAPIAMKSPMRGPIISVASTSAISSGSTLVQTSSASGATTFTASTEALPAGNDATFATDVQPTVPAPITVSANPGEQVSISLSVSDPDGNPITSFTADLSSLPSGNNAVFTPNGTNTAGTFTWTPALADSGNYGVTFNAVNALVSSAQAVISVGNSLSAYWRLNGNGADGAKGNALVPVGGATFAAGKLNLAADVNGSGPSRLQAPASHAYDLLPAGFTAECWVKPRSLSFAPDPTIARADSGGDAEAWELFVCGTGCPTGRVGVRVRHLGSLTELVSTQLINDGTFHHVATTYDGATLKLYVDGVPDDSLATPGLEARVGGGMIVLGNSAAGTSQFDGFIDDFRIWTKVKTASQILTAMNSELGSPSGVGDQAPRFSFALFQNRPNPFNPHTRIRFDLPRAGHSRLYIYDVQGRLVTRLIDGELPAGAHTFDWSGSDARGRAVASGIYFYRLEAAGFSSTRRMALLR